MVAARERGGVSGGHRVTAPRWVDGAGAVTGALGTTETTAQVTRRASRTALLRRARARGSTLRLGVVEEMIQRDGHRPRRPGSEARCSTPEAIVLAMGPWTTQRSAGCRLPPVHGSRATA